ncbi:MAG: guanylate kinase [Planctomycetota bacterium]
MSEKQPTASSQEPTAAARGRLLIVSGPSGVGKSTIIPLVRKRFGERLRMSVSATTRPPRPGEVDGVNYHFLSHDDFQQRLAAGQFLEAVEVFGRGHWYGTPMSEVIPSLEKGVWVLLEIDVDGAERALKRFPDALTLFIAPAADADESARVLEQRLRVRGTESEEAISRRLEVARSELSRASRYDHVIINDSVERSADAICGILRDRGIDS